MEWQPIETAPKDGTEVLVWGTRHRRVYPDQRRLVARYERGWWSHGAVVSHVELWMPLPEPSKK